MHVHEDKLHIIMLRKLKLMMHYFHLGEVSILAADEWEISPDDLELQGNLGKGQFGNVKLAFIKNMSCSHKLRNYINMQVAGGESFSTSRAVAVKYLRGTQFAANYT